MTRLEDYVWYLLLSIVVILFGCVAAIALKMTWVVLTTN